MYYRHHSQHWLQQWFNARFLMTPSLILVFWDLTLAGLWPVEMVETLISCILDNTDCCCSHESCLCSGMCDGECCGWMRALLHHAVLLRRWPWYLYQLRVTSAWDSLETRMWTDQLHPGTCEVRVLFFTYFLKEACFENTYHNIWPFYFFF